MTRSWWVFGVLLGSASVAAASPERLCKDHEAKGPCEAKEFVYARVKKGCEDNGRRGASSAMRMMMLKANQKRAELTCKSCHNDPHEQDYGLREGAHDLAAKWFEGEERTSRAPAP